MQPFRLIVGLGNPGRAYQGTRHNIGFAVLDTLTAASFKEDARGPVQVARDSASEIRFIKPQTFMNASGPAVEAWLSWLKFTPADLLVIVDDFALPFGELRLRERGSHGGHNGLRSIEQALGTSEYARIRLGIGPVPEQWAVEDFVLARFTAEESKAVPALIARAGDAFRCCQRDGIALAMTSFNSKSKKAEEKTDQKIDLKSDPKT